MFCIPKQFIINEGLIFEIIFSKSVFVGSIISTTNLIDIFISSLVLYETPKVKLKLFKKIFRNCVAN